jgi:hypothetical protein
MDDHVGVRSVPARGRVALGDTRLSRDESWRSQSFPCVQTNADHYGMLYGLAVEDGLPVEVARSSGQLVGIRIEFTNDVVELEAIGEGQNGVSSSSPRLVSRVARREVGAQ